MPQPATSRAPRAPVQQQERRPPVWAGTRMRPVRAPDAVQRRAWVQPQEQKRQGFRRQARQQRGLQLQLQQRGFQPPAPLQGRLRRGFRPQAIPRRRPGHLRPVPSRWWAPRPGIPRPWLRQPLPVRPRGPFPRSGLLLFRRISDCLSPLKVFRLEGNTHVLHRGRGGLASYFRETESIVTGCTGAPSDALEPGVIPAAAMASTASIPEVTLPTTV